MPVVPVELPQRSLLLGQAGPADHVDGFAIDVSGQVSLQAYVAAFYTTWLFKLERAVLRLAGYPSQDAQAQALARGERQAFAYWRLKERTEHQLLMRDLSGATCSWLMVAPTASGTRLFFGSGVRARKVPGQDSGRLARSYRALMGLHLAYSRALLAAAAKRVEGKQKTHGQEKI
jgi:hypothetical protein